MPKITWKIGGQEAQKRKMSSKCSENSKKTQKGQKGLQGEGEAVLIMRSSAK